MLPKQIIKPTNGAQRLNRLHFVGVLRTNKAMLMLCIGIALLFWLLTKLSKTYQTSFDVHLTYIAPHYKTLRTAPPDKLTVEVRAKGWQLLTRYLNDANPTVQLSIPSNATELSGNLLRTTIAKALPDELEILRFAPESITVALDMQAHKKVPIMAAIEVANAAAAYKMLKPLRFLPDSVEVEGPKTEVMAIKYWYTDSLSFSALQAQPKGSLNIAKHPNSKVVFRPNIVLYDTELEQVTEKIVEIMVSPRHNSDSVQLFPHKIQVVCTVGLSHYEALTADDIEVFADFRNIDYTRNTTVPIKVARQPNWARVKQLLPNRADFIIIKKTRGD
jgi:hypothetical protein